MDVSCVRGETAGIGWYVVNLLSGLERLDRDNQYLLYTFYARSRKFALERGRLPSAANFRVLEKPIPFRLARLLLESAAVRAESVIGPLDVFHALDHTAPQLRDGRLVVTIHDLASLAHPGRQYTSPEFQGPRMSRVRALAERADLIIAVSHHTKRDIERLLGISPAKIRVVYEAAEQRFKPLDSPTTLAAARLQYHLPDRFVLFVGTLEPRKNIPVLLRAYDALIRGTQIEHKLVIVGRLGWSYGEVFKTIADLHLEKHVLWLGHVPREDLPVLYNLAAVFVYPSAYEGFGLPPVEAMACGTPVVAPDNSCFPEVLGEAAMLVQSSDVHALADGLCRMIADDDLRARYASLGIARAACFSWDSAAKETLDVYTEASRL